MIVAVDTNVWARYLTWDDEKQSRQAAEVIENADALVVPTIVLCELAWVLKKAYGCGAQEIADALRDIAGSVNVSVDRPAVEAGLAALSAGADFADGVIRFEAERLQADRLYTFDRAFARGVDTGKVVLLG